MNANNVLHIILPFTDPHDVLAAFSVATVMARKLNAPLHVLAPERHLAAAQGLAQSMHPPAAAPDAWTVEAAAGDLVDATAGKVAAATQAIVIVAMRLYEAPPGAPQASETDARRMLEKISCPLLVVPPEHDLRCWQLRRELLPQDGTPSCASALAQIVQHFAQAGVESLVLRVAGAEVGQPTEPGSLPTPRYVDHPQYEWEAWGQEFLERVCGMGAGAGAARMRLLMANGEPAAEILRIAQEECADMIILPWHRVLRSGRARMLKAVLRQSPCPVLLVPQGGIRRKRQP